MYRFVAMMLLVGAVQAFATSEADAAPIGIGTFTWQYDPSGAGSVFVVANDSSDPFIGTSIDLLPPGGTLAFQTLLLGDIAAGSFAQSTQDLSLYLVPDDLNTAVLRFTYQGNLLNLSIAANALAGGPTGPLSYSAQIDSPAPVPEPSTLALLGTGLVVASRRWRKFRRSA